MDNKPVITEEQALDAYHKIIELTGLLEAVLSHLLHEALDHPERND